MTWHREVISQAVERTLRDLEQNSALSGFYLAGGTGLALHLGHRRSEDLDFFASQAFEEEPLIQRLQKLSGFSLASKSPSSVHAAVHGTNLSFLAYAYPVLYPFETYVGVSVADPRDIACMKISAIASRGTRRDFVDLYALARRYGLEQLLALFREKFAQVSYSPVHVLKSLAYFEDAEKEPMPDLLAPVSWAEVKEFFAAEVRRLV